MPTLYEWISSLPSARIHVSLYYRLENFHFVNISNLFISFSITWSHIFCVKLRKTDLISGFNIQLYTGASAIDVYVCIISSCSMYIYICIILYNHNHHNHMEKCAAHIERESFRKIPLGVRKLNPRGFGNCSILKNRFSNEL